MWRTSRVLALGGAALFVLAGCRRKHVHVDSVSELPYPTCSAATPSALALAAAAAPPARPPTAQSGASASPGAGELVVRRKLRGIDDAMTDVGTVETFAIERRACLVVVSGRQEWSRGATDVEIVFDEALRPLRAWKRMTAPDSKRADGNADVRRYELRTPEVTLVRRTADGPRTSEVLPGARPTAIIAPGRGLLTPWIQRARLGIGEKTRETVLDIREMFEVLREVTLRREEDRFEPTLNRTVRVYTVYGREAVFADEDDVVIGDLAGLRPTETIASPEPAPLPTFGMADPRGTP